MSEKYLELARKALEMADEASVEASRLFREGGRLASKRDAVVTVAVEEAAKTAQWSARRAQLAASEASTRANYAVTVAFDSSPEASLEAENALKSAHHARWLLQAAAEACDRAKRLRSDFDDAAREAHQWSHDSEDAEDRQTLVDQARTPPISKKIPES